MNLARVLTLSALALACDESQCPALLVLSTQRGDGACSPDCDTISCKYDYGDCISTTHPWAAYVSPSASGHGSLDSPYGSVAEAVQNLWATATTIYLLAGTHFLNAGADLIVAGDVTVTNVCEGLCAPAVLQLGQLHSQLVVTNRLTLRNIVVQGGFSLTAGCPSCTSCPRTSASAGQWVNSRGETIAPQSACDVYSARVLFLLRERSRLTLTSVWIANITHQLKAVVSGVSAEVELEDVRFTNITVRRSGPSGGLNSAVIELSALDSFGFFHFYSGAVELINNDREYTRDDTSFCGFLRVDNTQEVKVSDVTFADALMSMAVLHLKRFETFSLTRCVFRANIVVYAPVYILSNSSEHSYVEIRDCVFIHNFGRLNAGVLSTFLQHLPDFSLKNCSFTSNFAQTFGVIDLRNYIPEVTFDNGTSLIEDIQLIGNTAPIVATFNATGSAQVQGVVLARNGATGRSGEEDIINAYMRHGDTYGSQLVATTTLQRCEGGILFQNTNVSLHNSEFLYGLCRASSPGVAFAGQCFVILTQFQLSGLLFAHNTGHKLLSLAGDDVVLANLTFRNNTNLDTLESVCVDFIAGKLRSIALLNCTFEDNRGLTRTVASVRGAETLLLDQVIIRRNYAQTTAAGLIVELSSSVAVTVRDSQFHSNRANSSGVLLLSATSESGSQLHLRVAGCSFYGNSATFYGSAVSLLGFLRLNDSAISNCTFAGNANAEGGAGIYAEFAAGKLAVVSSVFTGNTGPRGAAIRHSYLGSDSGQALLNVSNSYFVNNSGESVVNAAGMQQCTVLSTDNRFVANSGSSLYIKLCSVTDSFSTTESAQTSKGGALRAESSSAFVANFLARNNSVTYGGGFYISSTSTVVCTNCTFVGNSAQLLGGGVYSDQSSVFTGTNLTLRENYSGDRAAAVYGHRSTVTLSTVLITRNRAKNYGALFCSSATFNLIDCDMSSNEAGARSPGVAGTLATVNVAKCKIHDQRGAKGGSFFLTDQSVGTVTDSAFWNNTADSGGAFVVIALSSLTIRNSQVWNCSATTDGGLLTSRISTIQLVNVTVFRITSTLTFGAFFMLQSTLIVDNSTLTDMTGSAVYATVSDVAIRSSHFARVFAGLGAGVNCAECTSLQVSNSTFAYGLAKVGGVINCYSMGTTPTALAAVISGNRFEHSRAVNGGAICSDSYYLTLTDNHFLNNSALSANYDTAGLMVRGRGGAVYSICPSLVYCKFVFANNSFQENVAEVSGGAVYWADSFPSDTGNSFRDNSASYGSEIGSFAVRLARVSASGSLEDYLSTGAKPLIAEISAIASGQLYSDTFRVALIDQYDHVVTTDSSSSAQLVASAVNVSVSGNTQVVARGGIFTFLNITISGPPKSTQLLGITTNGINLRLQSSSRDPTDYFATVSLQVSFRDCEVGESLQNNECKPCPVNTFSLDPADPCMSCPSHAICYGTYQMVPEAGYWRPDPFRNLFFECANSDACLGSPDPSEPSLTGLCAPGYMGNLCNSCESQYSAQGNGLCSRCPNFTSNVILTAFLVVIVLMVFSVVVLVAINGAKKPRSELAIFLKILLNYSQMIMVAASLNLSWPNYVQKFLRTQQLVGNATDQLMSIECLLKQFSAENVYYTNVTVYVTFPCALLGLCALFWQLAWICSRVENPRQKLVVTLVLVIFILHTSLTKVMFSLFCCRELLPGELWLVSNLQTRCWDSEHVKNILMLGVPGIIVWVVGLPSLCLIVLVSRKRYLADYSTRLMLSFLYKGYRPEWYFWEFVILYRKIIIVCTSVFLTTVSIVVQALSMLGVILVCLFLQQHVQPFLGADFNSLELKALLASLLTIYSGLYFQTKSTRKA